MVIVNVSHEGYVLRSENKRENFKDVLKEIIVKEKSNAISDVKDIHVFFYKIDKSPEHRIKVDILFAGPKATERSVSCTLTAVTERLSQHYNIVVVVTFNQKARVADWRSKKK